MENKPHSATEAFYMGKEQLLIEVLESYKMNEIERNSFVAQLQETRTLLLTLKGRRKPDEPASNNHLDD